MIKKNFVVSVFVLLSAIANLESFADTFQLTSNQIKNNGKLTTLQEFNGFDCKGLNIAPDLKWANPPKGVKSYAITLFDEDAPTGSGWWHWVVINIPANTRELTPSVKHKNITLVRNDYGEKNYGGPCPPMGDQPHRYVFKVWALDTEKINAPSDASPALIGFMLNKHKIQVSQLTVTYSRH